MKIFKKHIIILVVILIICFIYFFLSLKQNLNKNIIQKDFKTINIATGEQIYTHGPYIYIYGKSGIKIFKNDTLLFEDSFSFENPYIATSYDKFAICDSNNKVAKVYSNNSLMYTINATNNILGFTVNKAGFLSIVFKNEDNYQIEVYNDTGDNIYSIKDISYNEGVPINLSISDDNKTLTVSYIKSKGATIDSNIVFYSMEEQKVFGGFIKSDQIVGITKFINKNNFVCVSDKEIFIINVNSTKDNEHVKEIYKKPLNNVLKSVKFLDGIGYMICYGKPTNPENFLSENTIIFYNSSGGEIGKYYEKNQNITNIYVNKYGAVLEKNRLFNAINLSGKKLWEYQATQDIKQVNFYNDPNTAIIVTNNEIKIVKISRHLLDKQIENTNNNKDGKDNISEDVSNDVSNEDNKNSQSKDFYNNKNKNNYKNNT